MKQIIIAILICATSALVDYSYQCYDEGDVVDSEGNKCAWYYNNTDSCGVYDTDDFNATNDCCACYGGYYASCTEMDQNGTLVDAGGDSCAWYYEDYGWYCGDYDTDTFEAEDACCVCDGGNWELGCTDYEGYDSGGDSCEWYKENDDSCGDWDTDTFKAEELCCWCDGGNWD